MFEHLCMSFHPFCLVVDSSPLLYCLLEVFIVQAIAELQLCACLVFLSIQNRLIMCCSIHTERLYFSEGIYHGISSDPPHQTRTRMTTPQLISSAAPPTSIPACTCQFCPIHAGKYSYLPEVTGTFLEEPEDLFDDLLREVRRIPLAKDPTRTRQHFEILGAALAKHGFHPGFKKSTRFLMVLYQHILELKNYDDEKEMFLMLGYLRKVINDMLDGMIDLWREDAPPTKPAVKEKNQAMFRRELKRIQEESDGLETWDKFFMSVFTDAYQEVGVPPGYGCSIKMVDAFTAELLCQDLDIEQILDLTRYLELLMNEFARQLSEASLGREDDFEEWDKTDSEDADHGSGGYISGSVAGSHISDSHAGTDDEEQRGSVGIGIQIEGASEGILILTSEAWQQAQSAAALGRTTQTTAEDTEDDEAPEAGT